MASISLKKRIISVSIRRMVDECPDLSHLGEYTNDREESSIDRQEQGDWSRGEYRYFTPAMTGEETGNPDSPLQDYHRAEAFNRGDWSYIGIRAEAEVSTTGEVVQQITSGGLWNIETDSEEDYLQSVEAEELASLREELEAMGFTTRQINAAFKNVSHVSAL